MTFSFSPKNNNNKRNKWNIKYTCTANTIYYKVYLLISMMINPGGVSSFNAFSTNELLTNFHYYCVIPENIHTPSTPRKTLWFAPPQDFPLQGDFWWPPSPQEFPEFLNGDFLPTSVRLANLRKAKILRFWTWSWEKYSEVGKSGKMSQLQSDMEEPSAGITGKQSRVSC